MTTADLNALTLKLKDRIEDCESCIDNENRMYTREVVRNAREDLKFYEGLLSALTTAATPPSEEAIVWRLNALSSKLYEIATRMVLPERLEVLDVRNEAKDLAITIHQRSLAITPPTATPSAINFDTDWHVVSEAVYEAINNSDGHISQLMLASAFAANRLVVGHKENS